MISSVSFILWKLALRVGADREGTHIYIAHLKGNNTCFHLLQFQKVKNLKKKNRNFLHNQRVLYKTALA